MIRDIQVYLVRLPSIFAHFLLDCFLLQCISIALKLYFPHNFDVNNVCICFLVNTHMHADHITGTGYLKQLLPNVHSIISAASGAQADQHLANGEVIQFGRHQIKAVSTPGHTNGCMTYINYEQVRVLQYADTCNG